MRLFGLLIACALTACATERCDSLAEIAGFVQTLPVANSARRAILEERLKETPDNFALNRLFLDASVYERSLVREHYERLLQAHPDSLDYQYLEGRSLVGSNTKEALRIYAEILGKDPDYPWVHLSQLEIYRSPAFRDRQKLQASFSAITRVCPAMFVPYGYVNEIPDNDIAARAAKKLRAMLSTSQDPRQLTYFRNLWAVEFRLRPVTEQDQERKQIAQDLKQLLAIENDTRINSVIESGAKLAGDDLLASRMASGQAPDTSRLLNDTRNAWLKEHPSPKYDDPSDRRHAYGAELLANSQEWRSMAPENATGDYDRVRALVFLNASEKEIATAGDELLALLRRQDPFESTWFVNLARVYMENNVLLDRIPGIVSEAIQRLDDPEAVIEIDLSPDHVLTAHNREFLIDSHEQALLILAQAYEKQGDRGKAHEALYQATDYLTSKAPSPDEKNDLVLSRYREARYDNLRTQAEIAEKEGRKLDALNGYREALTVLSNGRQQLMSRQRKLWQELGGTDEGWQQWMDAVTAGTPEARPSRAPDRPEYSAANRKLPPLSAQDTEGRQWTLNSFAGKTTIAIVWATWCAPCRAELPYFAKLVGQLKNNDVALAVSFNTDDNIAVAESFAKSHGYTFPVISAKQYAEDLMPLVSIPRTWIIKNGVIAQEYRGFGSNGQEKWVEEMLLLLK